MIVATSVRIELSLAIRCCLAVVLVMLPTASISAGARISLATLDWPPYISQSLPLNGYVHEVVVTAFERAGIATEISFYPWARAAKLVESGRVDVLFPEYYGKEKEADFAFSTPFKGGPVGLLKRKSLNVKWSVDPQKSPLKNLQSLAKYRFGVVRGYVNTEAFDNTSFLDKEEVVSDEINLRLLSAKRIDFIFIDKFVASYFIQTKYPHYKSQFEFMIPAM